jgi:hypothetical protein
MQLAFLNETSESMGGKTAEIAFAEGLLNGRRNVGREDFAVME